MIGVSKNQEGFVVAEIIADQFQAFLHMIGFKGTYFAKDFKKTDVPRLSTVLLHIIMKVYGKTWKSWFHKQ